MGTFGSTRDSSLQAGSLRATVFQRLRVALAVILATAFALFHLTAFLPVPSSPELPSRGQLEFEFEWHSVGFIQSLIMMMLISATVDRTQNGY